MKFQSSPCRLAFAAITLSAITASPAITQPIHEVRKLLQKDTDDGDLFGRSVAISGNTAVVGAQSDEDKGYLAGSAYLFDITTGNQLFKLLANDGTALDFFGASVAISGTSVLVGAPGDYEDVEVVGAAYLFDATSGTQLSKILPSDGEDSDQFGYSVAISDNTIVVGAPQDDDNGLSSGSVYLFDTTTGQQIAKLLPSDGASSDKFGSSVAISGTTAIVGAPYHDGKNSDSGAAYLFDTITGQQLMKFRASDGEMSYFFGQSVAISGTTAVVGAPLDTDDGIQSGAVYVFDISTGKQTAKLLHSDRQNEDYFGHQVAISGSTAVVGTPLDEVNDIWSGSAYLFDTTSGRQIAKLLPSDGERSDRFGFSVAISETAAVVGGFYQDSSNESAYVFSTSLCFPDYNGDTILDFSDVSAFIGAFTASDPIADFNLDGSFNFFDVSAFLVAYLAGCP